jgi:hypothetical protein
MKLFMKFITQKMSGVLFKINFEKAYDKVNWAFLYQMMQARGLGDVLYDSIMKVVRGGRCAVKVNDTIRPYFSHLCRGKTG